MRAVGLMMMLKQDGKEYPLESNDKQQEKGKERAPGSGLVRRSDGRGHTVGLSQARRIRSHHASLYEDRVFHSISEFAGKPEFCDYRIITVLRIHDVKRPMIFYDQSGDIQVVDKQIVHACLAGRSSVPILENGICSFGDGMVVTFAECQQKDLTYGLRLALFSLVANRKDYRNVESLDRHDTK